MRFFANINACFCSLETVHKLLEFIRTHKHWLLFILLEVIALFMLFNNRMYHRSLGLLTGNYIVGHMSESMTEWKSYLNLRKENDELLEENARLERQYLVLKRYMDDKQSDSIVPNVYISDSLEMLAPYEFLTARIVSINNRMHANVHYIINKGKADGIKADMPVMSKKGVVGIVTNVSEHYSVVIPIINPGLKLSCNILGQEISGTLTRVTRSSNMLALTELPLHARIKNGDTIVTSGYSFIFPQNLMVGVVQTDSLPNHDSQRQTFSSYPVKTATDFNRLTYVYVILNEGQEEAKELKNISPGHAKEVD